MKQRNSLRFITLIFITILNVSTCTTVQEAPVVSEKPANLLIVAKKGGDYSRIQDAINAAAPGFIIRIKEGIYYETINISTPGITLEAFDPIAETVIIDGSDDYFYEVPPLWSLLETGIYTASYDWPLPLLEDEEYTKAGEDQAEKPGLFFVYEDDILLRGYRSPYAPLPPKKYKKQLYGDEYGLGGLYTSPADFSASDSFVAVSETGKNDFLQGRFAYDADKKIIFIHTADNKPPSGHEYHIPVKKHLVYITADNVKIKNIVFRYAASYAILIENCSQTNIDQCIFNPTHLAVAVRNSPNSRITNNFIGQKGFWEQYTSQDIIGTRFEASTISIDSSSASDGTEISRNIINGAPFFITPARSKYSVHDNIAAYSPLGVWGTARLANSASTLNTTISVYNNIFHHFGMGIQIPPFFSYRGKLYMYRNYFYFSTQKKWETETHARPVLLENFYFYNNTVVVAGDEFQEIVPTPIAADVFYQNNLFYAKNILYRYFVGAQQGQYPLALTPQLGKNIYCGPLEFNNTFSEFQYRDDHYLYIKTDLKKQQPKVKEIKENTSGVFEHYFPLEEESFYNSEFDTFRSVTTKSMKENGWENFFTKYWDALASRFQINAESIARNKAENFQHILPDSLIISDELPDIGADEFNRQ
ncbi:MAG: hypothetical protein JW904_11715 [Spirochaetales bacterium]|nr:hypothetical protein [Spirochaetales bacterium]